MCCVDERGASCSATPRDGLVADTGTLTVCVRWPCDIHHALEDILISIVRELPVPSRSRHLESRLSRRNCGLPSQTSLGPDLPAQCVSYAFGLIKSLGLQAYNCMAINSNNKIKPGL